MGFIQLNHIIFPQAMTSPTARPMSWFCPRILTLGWKVNLIVGRYLDPSIYTQKHQDFACQISKVGRKNYCIQETVCNCKFECVINSRDTYRNSTVLTCQDCWHIKKIRVSDKFHLFICFSLWFFKLCLKLPPILV